MRVCFGFVGTLLALVAFSSTVRSDTRISGIYIAADTNSANMLQLVEAPKGQVTGVLTLLRLASDGRLETKRGQVSGTFGDNTIVLAVRLGPMDLTAIRFAGQADGSTVRLQFISAKGEVATSTMVRGSISEFEAAAKRLRARAQELGLSATLAKQIETAERNLRATEAWMVDARGRLQNLPGVKAQYRALSERMAALAKQAQVTADDVRRGQLSIAMSQAEIAGDQADVRGELVWGRLERNGRDFERMFEGYRSSCAAANGLSARGAPLASVHRWKKVCEEISQTAQRFGPILERVVSEKRELKHFQAEQKRKRTQLIEQSSRVE